MRPTKVWVPPITTSVLIAAIVGAIAIVALIVGTNYGVRVLWGSGAVEVMPSPRTPDPTGNR